MDLSQTNFNLPLSSYQMVNGSQIAVKTRKDLEIQLITRALKHKLFKQELLDNPKQVIEAELGTELPDELEIDILEETQDVLYMILPHNPYDGISEEKLKNLVGMTYEDVAQWVLEQQTNNFSDQENFTKIIAKTWSDEVFKQELFSNPTKVIETELEENTFEDIKIKVFVETPEKLYFVMPTILEEFDISGSKTSFLSEVNLLMVAAAGSGGTENSGEQLVLTDFLAL